IRAELALWQGRLDDAAEQVRLGVIAVQSGENALELLRLCAIGLRCAADRKAADRALVGGQLAGLAANALTGKPATAEIEQLKRLCAAERRRIRGMDKAVLWSGVATGWADLDQRYRAAYARWREAEAALVE